MLNLSKKAIYVISLPGWEEVFLKFPTSGGVRRGSGGGPGGSRPAGPGVNGSVGMAGGSGGRSAAQCGRSGRVKTRVFH